MIGQTIIEYFSPMPFGRKIMMIFTFLAMIGCSMPWFFEKMTTYSALNHLHVFGYSIIVCLFSILYIGLREHFQKKSSFCSIPNSYWFLFLLAIALYTTLLNTVVLYHLLMYSPDSMVRWGGMMTFVSSGMAMMGIFFSWEYVPTLVSNTNNHANVVITKEQITLKPERTFTQNIHE